MDERDIRSALQLGRPGSIPRTTKVLRDAWIEMHGKEFLPSLRVFADMARAIHREFDVHEKS